MESISTVGNGVSFTYDLTVSIASSGDGAGGSGIFQRGRTLAIAPLLFMNSYLNFPNCVNVGSCVMNYQCIDPLTKVWAPAETCYGRPTIASVTTVGVPHSRRRAEAQPRRLNAAGASAWPTTSFGQFGGQNLYESAEAVGLPLPEVVGPFIISYGWRPLEDDWTPLSVGSVYTWPTDPQVRFASDVVGNVGRATLLSIPKETGTYTYEMPGDDIGGMVCKVTATVSPASPSQLNGYFKLLAVNSNIYVPNTPCPFQWQLCSLSFCQLPKYGEMYQCRPGPLGYPLYLNTGYNVSEILPHFESITVDMVTTRKMAVTPMVSGWNYEVLDVADAEFSGPWNVYDDPPTSANYSITLSEEMLNTDKGFGSVTVSGSSPDTPVAVCNLCTQPNDVWNTTSTVVPLSSDYRSAYCSNHWFGSGGPDPSWASPPPSPAAPPSPSPPPPTPAAPPSAFLVVTTLALSGTVSDYGQNETDAIAEVVAKNAGTGYSASDAMVTMTAGSVISTSTLHATGPFAQAAAVSSLQSAFNSADAATALLRQQPALADVTVAMVSVVASSPIATGSDDWDSGIIAGIAVGATVAFLIICGLALKVINTAPPAAVAKEGAKGPPADTFDGNI